MRSYDAPIEKVYQATIRSFQNLGLAIFEENKEKGYIEGGRKPGFARGAENVGVFMENGSGAQTSVRIDNRKAIWGYALAVDWTPKVFEQIEEELKK
ncbi:hypothetical protein [Nitrospira sp. Nam74]